MIPFILFTRPSYTPPYLKSRQNSSNGVLRVPPYRGLSWRDVPGSLPQRAPATSLASLPILRAGVRLP